LRRRWSELRGTGKTTEARGGAGKLGAFTRSEVGAVGVRLHRGKSIVLEARPEAARLAPIAD
jgi:hypothetical protein